MTMTEVTETHDTQEETKKETNATEETTPKTYTESEVDSRISKAVDSALTKNRQKWEQEERERIEAAKKDAERLAKLSEKERKDEELKQREEQLNSRLKELEAKELKNDAIADLSTKGLPAAFADFLVADTGEKTLENINAFKETFDSAVEEAVKGKLRQDPPKLGSFKSQGNSIPNKAEMARNARIIK